MWHCNLWQGSHKGTLRSCIVALPWLNWKFCLAWASRVHPTHYSDHQIKHLQLSRMFHFVILPLPYNQHGSVERSSSKTICSVETATPTSCCTKSGGLASWRWGCRHPCQPFTGAMCLVLSNRPGFARCVGISWLRAVGQHLLPAALTRDCSKRGWRSGRTAPPCRRHRPLPCSGHRKGHWSFWPRSCTAWSSWVAGKRAAKKSEVRALGGFARCWLGFPAMASWVWWQGMTEGSTS